MVLMSVRMSVNKWLWKTDVWRTDGVREQGAEEARQWEVTLSRRNPITGEPERLYCIARGRTRQAAEKARDELIA